MKKQTRKRFLQSGKVTSTDVARAAGCSQASVSKVLNGQGHLSEPLRRKVLEQARKLNYGWRRDKLRRLAVILPAAWQIRPDNYVAALLNAMVYVLYQRNIQVEFVPMNDLERLRSRAIDGGISIAIDPGLTAAWFEKFQLPLVRINANPVFDQPDSLLAHVNMDSAKSMSLLLEKLYSLGHRHILLLAPETIEIEQRRARYQGFFDYLKSHRVHHPEKNCIFGMRSNSFEQNLALLKQAVSNGTTALIAVDEGAARDALNLIEKLKLNVPKRISVVSWEQKNVLPYFDPPVTGMAMDYTQLSETAVDLLSALCRGEKVSDVFFPFRMIERESVGPVFRRKTGSKLTERILAVLADGPETRVDLAAALDLKPYCGYFNRAVRELLNEKRIVYQKKETPGRKRLLSLPSGD